jgi:hypothetical protein
MLFLDFAHRLRKGEHRMKSSKWIMGLLTFAAFLAMSTSSFAQVSIILSNSPSANEVASTHMANTADPTSQGNGLTVSGQSIAQINLTTTYLTLKFGGPITSTIANELVNGNGGPGLSSPTVTAPPNDPIQLVGATGLFSGSYITTMNTSSGTITVVLPGALNSNSSGSFRVIGVRIDPTGLTAPVLGSVTLSAASNGYIAPSPNTFTTITALPAGIANVTQGAYSGATNYGTGLILTNGNIAASTASIYITEGCAFCWRSAADEVVNPGGAVPNGTQIRVTVNGIPAGITVGVSLIKSSTLTVSSSATSVKAASSSSLTANQFTITIGGDSQTAVENIEVQFTFQGTPTGALSSGSITATATLAPIGTGVDSTLTTPAPDSTSLAVGFPVFTDVEVGPATIASITAANTTLLVPYVVTVGNYDTGIEVANTTADPFGGAANFGATAANGPMTFYIYSDNATRNGSASLITLTTSSTKIFGQGLDSSGNLDAGSIWTGSLASDILPAAGVTPGSTGFFGYMLIQTSFLDAHGISLTYNGAGTSYGAPLLVLPILSATNNRSNLSNGAESLNN